MGEYPYCEGCGEPSWPTFCAECIREEEAARKADPEFDRECREHQAKIWAAVDKKFYMEDEPF